MGKRKSFLWRTDTANLLTIYSSRVTSVGIVLCRLSLISYVRKWARESSISFRCLCRRAIAGVLRRSLCTQQQGKRKGIGVIECDFGAIQIALLLMLNLERCLARPHCIAWTKVGEYLVCSRTGRNRQECAGSYRPRGTFCEPTSPTWLDD